MAMPVQAATAIFSPQPIRPPLKKENNQEDDTWLSRAGDTPSILSSVFEGWPSFVLSSPSPPPDDEHIKSETRPPNPSPPSPDSVDYQSARSESLDSTTSHEHKHKQHKKSHRRQRSSIAIGNEVNDLLNKDHVRKAISVLQEAVSWMHMTDDPGQSPGSVAKIYSRMLKTLCEPNLSSVVNEISGVDPKEPGAIYNCVVWRLFTKVVESGYTLELDHPFLDGISASLAANIMFMFSFAYWMLLLARFLQGVSNACVWTMCLCLIADNWPSDQLGLQMGKLVGFYPLGMMIGLPVGVLYSRVSPQAPFVASLVFSGMDFFMRLVIIERSSSPKEWFIDNDVESSNSNAATEEEPQPTRKPRRVTLIQLIKQPRLIVSMLLTMVVASVMSAFEPTLSMRLAAEWDFDAAASGLILIAYMAPSIASSAFCGWLCDRYGTKIVAMVSLTLVTPACIAIGVPDHHTSFWTLIPVLVVGGMTIAGCQAPVFPEIAAVVAASNPNKNDRDGLARSYAVFNAAYGTDILKVVLIGDGGVGKTSLRNQFIHKRFTNTYKATIGADFITKEVLLDDGKKVMMQIWDTAGQERFQSLGVAYYRGADACVLVYDVNNFMSFQHLGRWHDDFLKQSSLPPEEAEHFPILMIGNKIDINDRVVSRRQARAWAEQHSRESMQIPCFEASAKDGTNVEKAFTHIAKMVKVPQLELDLNEGDTLTLTSDTRSTKTGRGVGCC
ncbi:Ras- protein Rab-7 [Apophysomyces sp. BC1021]|nr:Ras- protein Rab-7 [Apophysomyces sp. BC1021]